MRANIRKMTRNILIGTACFMAATGVAMAEEEKPTADLTVSAYSQYVWRGWAYTKDSIVVQPSMTVGYKGFAANVWGNLDTDVWNSADQADTNSWTETDLTLSYDWAMGPVGLSAGWIYYGLDAADDSQEIYLSAGLDTLLSPTLSVYRDYDNYPGWYITLDVSHSFPITGDIALDLGAKVSYYTADEADVYADPDDANDAYSDFHDGVLSASVSIPVNEYISIAPEVYYSFPLSSGAEDRLKADNQGTIGRDDDDFIYGGLSVSFAF